ncbi:bolA-like protein 1 isoform X2 [Hyla sarda]|uniref:bolA-like protein 1 isoform X2 n=1 Tax=Hyla sarda TaxID=327740 RepID=UPI0024C300B6|nr:bolA-like protein 1 isoform X2 [Hyla sarda]
MVDVFVAEQNLTSIKVIGAKLEYQTQAADTCVFPLLDNLELLSSALMLPTRLLQSCRRVFSNLTSKYSGLPNMEKPVETSIKAKLTQNLEPCHLEVHNESYMHAVPPGSETHFKVVVVSDVFSGKSLIQRHRLVNDLLKEELAGPVHALSIQAKTPQQWEENPTVGKSPGCMGGSKHDPQMGKKISSQV